MSQIICADAISGLRGLPDNSVNMCVTSPPYYGLRSYGTDGQIGQESSPEEYIQRLVAVFCEVHRVLKDDGTLWINIADTYCGTGNKGDCIDPKYPNGRNGQRVAINQTVKGCKPKDMIGIPWMLAFALRANGWYLRSDIIWHKVNAMPENVHDRPTRSYEHIFLLSKSRKYFYNADAIAEPLCDSSIKRYKHGRTHQTKHENFTPYDHITRTEYFTAQQGKTHRNKRDVWSLSTNTYRMQGHFAMYPEQLVEPCILAGSKEGDIILDPFFGSGTTGVVAKRYNRDYIGIDINHEYCRLAAERIATEK